MSVLVEFEDEAIPNHFTNILYTRKVGTVERDFVGRVIRETKPIDMILHCPKCNVQHIDAPDPDPAVPLEEVDLIPRGPIWTNPPHRSHLCHACGCIWRPADVPTNGVAAIATKGKADNWTGKSRSKTIATFEKIGEAKPSGVLELFSSPQWPFNSKDPK